MGSLFMPHGTGPGYTISATPPPPVQPWVPTFLTGVTISNPSGSALAENPYYFATPETAMTMAQRFGALGVEADQVGYGPYVVSQPEQVLLFPGTKASGPIKYPAGPLAYYFIQYPEDKFPGVAESIVWQAIANLEAKATK